MGEVHTGCAAAGHASGFGRWIERRVLRRVMDTDRRLETVLAAASATRSSRLMQQSECDSFTSRDSQQTGRSEREIVDSPHGPPVSSTLYTGPCCGASAGVPIVICSVLLLRSSSQIF